MTRITFNRAPNRLTVDGHAGYRPGCDPVCAGISALVYALLGYLDGTGYPYACDIGDGFATLECDRCDEAFETVAAGLSMIAEEYPQAVSFTEDITGNIPCYNRTHGKDRE